MVTSWIYTLNDIEDTLLLVVQHKLFHLNGSDIVDFIMALRDCKEKWTGYRQTEIGAYGRLIAKQTRGKTDTESGAIGWYLGTRDGLQTDDTYRIIVRKGATRKLEKWVCEACNMAVDYPIFRYRLEAVVADDTAHTIVVMFNDTATELLKCSAESLMGTKDEYSDADDELNLPMAIRNLIGTEHVLEINSHTYYEYGSFESFNCWKINPNASAEDDASSSTPVVTANDVEPSMRIVMKPPTVCTPLKPNEEKKQKGHDLEDSDVDEVSGPLKNTRKSNVVVAVDTKKKRKSHVVALTPGSAITIPETTNEFTIKGNHLTLVKGNQFDGRTKTDPHKHIHEFLGICYMFKYRDTENEAVRLMMFPLSLTGEAKTWLDELNEGTIETWDELRTAFVS
ncbi:reverse transcriptase domain-containing protein [Tanacetum coccineum]